MAPAHGEPHDDDMKLKEALHGGVVEGRARKSRRLPKQASETARSRFGGQRGRVKRNEQAEKAAKGAVVQGPDGPSVVSQDVPAEQLVTNPKLGSYDAIAEALD